MLATSNSLNAQNFPIFQPILMKLVLKFMVYRALSDKWLLSPLRKKMFHSFSYSMNVTVTSQNDVPSLHMNQRALLFTP